VAGALAASGIDPSMLKLEITESILMADAPTSVNRVAALRSLGVNVQIDDFGTGYSSFGYLHRLKADTIKIDRSLIDGLAESAETREIVRAIIALGHQLNVTIVAEGVETGADFGCLEQMSCDFVQGYLVAEPLEEGDVPGLICGTESLLPARRVRWVDFDGAGRAAHPLLRRA